MKKETNHRGTETQREPLSPQYNIVSGAIVDSAYRVHSALGPGLLESVYELCLAHDLTKGGFEVRRQVELPVVFDGLRLEGGFRLDLVVNDLVIVELKAVDAILPVHKAQRLLINFNVPVIKSGIVRLIL